jgi:hypothetical protein
MKKILITGKVKLQLQAEVYNLFNYSSYRAVVTKLSAANFRGPTQTDDPRVFQCGLKLLF